MQSDKEKLLQELVKFYKEKTLDRTARYFLGTIVLYFLLLCGFISLGYLIFTDYNLFQTDAASARYMLSALVQSQAAIVAIVVSLTLIAVQLTASAYSHRVIDVFKSPKKNPDFWILLGVYGLSILYGLFLLKMVVGTEGELVNQTPIWPTFHPIISFEFCVSFAYWLGTFAFVILIPYMWNIINLLKPETIINRLATNITPDNLLNPEENSIQPIMDIVHGSIMKSDLETTRVGLKAVTDYIIVFIVAELIGKDNQSEIFDRFCISLKFAGKLALSRDNEESTIEVLNKLLIFGLVTAEKGLETLTEQAAISLGDIGRVAAEKKFESVVRRAAESLEGVGKFAAEKERYPAIGQVAVSLATLGLAAVEKELKVATRVVAHSLGVVGVAAAEKGADITTGTIACLLRELGCAAAEKELEDETCWAAESLARLALVSEESVKGMIQGYELELKEKNRETFRKFMEVYEQELEKLRLSNKNDQPPQQANFS